MSKDNGDNQNEDNGKMTAAKAGRKGGESVSEKYWPEFYLKIGKEWRFYPS